MDFVCIDTAVLIYLLKGEDSILQPGMVDKTKRWFDRERLNGTSFMIPSVVHAEFLSAFPPEQHTVFNNLVGMSFHVAPLDANAAIKFAEIRYKKMEVLERLKQSGQYRPNQILVDCQITAIALAHGAKTIYTEEESLHQIATGLISVSRVPNIAAQLNLL